MTQLKIDYVVEAVRFSPSGDLEKIRLYERRGASYSDLVVYTREELIRALESGKTVMAGNRKPYLASTFNLTGGIQLAGTRDVPVVVLGDDPSAEDSLPGIPRF